jgi:hypothetical protein
MTTSNLVGPESRSSQAFSASTAVDTSLLIGATERLSAYNRLKSWLRLPQAEATAAATAFQDAVKRLPPLEQEQIAEAEADALRHGFSFADVQKLRHLALRAIEDPFVALDGLPEDRQSAYLVASMLAFSN